MKLLSPVMESITCVTHVDDLRTIHMVLWKQIFNVAVSMCGAIWPITCWLVPLFWTIILQDINYLDILQNGLPEQLEDVSLATLIPMYFQHDRPPSHYTQLVMQHLSDTFPNRWISHGSTINCPPRSPGLISLDFCLCGLMKSKVYRRKVMSRCTQTSNMPCSHMSCKVHWCWWWHFRKCIILSKLYIYTFLLRGTDTMTSWNIDLSSWGILYIVRKVL
jgi:hypothetical protein